MYKLIPLTQDKFSKVDPEDYVYLMKFKWCCPKGSRGRLGYAKRTIRLPDGKRKNILMHRFIMGDPKGLQIDHINGDTLDNRKSNLRVATPSENSSNKKGHGVLGVKGIILRVYRGKKGTTSKYIARIKKNGKQIYLGRFDTLDEAKAVYQKNSTLLFGEFAKK